MSADAVATARDRFCELIARPDPEIPLAETALWIAAEAHHGLDVDEHLARLDELAEAAAPLLSEAGSFADQVARLNRFLFVREGFLGNTDAYQDPENSFLDSVIERRRGIPITLSVVYVEVARRLGLAASGVGFPGHFLTRVAGADSEVIVDAFFGCVLSREECEARLSKVTGKATPLDDTMLLPSTHGEIVCRILRNLKQIYVARKELESALGCCERILLVDPDDLIEVRDRGLVYQQLECYGPALHDLERFVEGMPGHPSSEVISKALGQLRGRARRIH